MIINIKPEVLDDMRANGQFESDGCACGDFFYKLDEHLWLTTYRSCRKSSMTPDEKLWQLHDIVFFDSIKFNYYTRDGKEYIDCISEFGNEVNVKMNEALKDEIYKILKDKTKEIWENEYRNQY